MTTSRPTKRRLDKIEQQLRQELPNIPGQVRPETRSFLQEILEQTFDIEIQTPQRFPDHGWETVIWVRLPIKPNTEIHQRAAHRLHISARTLKSVLSSSDTDPSMLYFDSVRNRGQGSEFSDALTEVGNAIAEATNLNYVDAPKIHQLFLEDFGEYYIVVDLMFTYEEGCENCRCGCRRNPSTRNNPISPNDLERIADLSENYNLSVLFSTVLNSWTFIEDEGDTMDRRLGAMLDELFELFRKNSYFQRSAQDSKHSRWDVSSDPDSYRWLASGGSRFSPKIKIPELLQYIWEEYPWPDDFSDRDLTKLGRLVPKIIARSENPRFT